MNPSSKFSPLRQRKNLVYLKRKAKRIQFWANALAIPLLVVGCGCGTLPEKPSQNEILSQPSPESPVPKLPPYPFPNAYEMLLQAAADTQPANAPVHSMGRGELSAYLRPHQETLKLARAAFHYESRVVLGTGLRFWQRHAEELAGLERLSDLFLADGLYAETIVQTQPAMEAYLEIMRLGQCAAKGGTLIDRLAGIAIEEKGARSLKSLLRKLSKENVDKTLESLKKFEKERVSAAAIREWEELLSQTLFAGDSPAAHKTDRQQVFAAINRHARNMRILLIRAAARKFEFLRGKAPESLSQLTPDILNSIPLDPFTGKPLSLSALAEPSQSSAPTTQTP